MQWTPTAGEGEPPAYALIQIALDRIVTAFPTVLDDLFGPAREVWGGSSKPGPLRSSTASRSRFEEWTVAEQPSPGALVAAVLGELAQAAYSLAEHEGDLDEGRAPSDSGRRSRSI